MRSIENHGQTDEAAAKFKKSLSIVTDDAFAMSRYAEVLHQQAKSDKTQGKLEDTKNKKLELAATHFNITLDISPDPFAYKHYAQVLAEQKKWELALKVWDTF